MKVRDRPAVAYTTGPVTRTLRVVAGAICAAGVTWTLISWPSLPGQVPTHLNASGTPDEFGPRWTLLIMLAVWVVMQVLLTWLSARPRIFNYPAPITDDNAQHLYREGERMMVWVCLGVSIVFAGVVGIAHELPAQALVVVGLILLAVSTMTGLIRTSLA